MEERCCQGLPQGKRGISSGGRAPAPCLRLESIEFRISSFVGPIYLFNSTWTHNPRTGTQSFAHARLRNEGGLEGVWKGAQPDSEITCCRDDADKGALPRARSVRAYIGGAEWWEFLQLSLQVDAEPGVEEPRQSL